MKKLHFIAWIITVIGYTLKVLHIPDASISIVLGTWILLIHGIIYLVKNAKTNLPTSALHLSVSLLLFYMMFKVMHFPGASLFIIFVIIALLATVFGCVLLIRKKGEIKLPQILLVDYLALLIVLLLTFNFMVSKNLLRAYILVDSSIVILKRKWIAN
jgi:hypothetical protein